MRRKTKPRVAWLPHTNANTILFSAPHPAGSSNVIEFVIAASGAAKGNVVTGIVPIVIDAAQNPGVATTSLADIEDSGYRLRRIVGKCFVSVVQDNQNAGGPGLLLVAAAFIILRVDASGAPLQASFLQYDLFDIENDDNPWIWRREWILQDGTSNVIVDFPHTNAEYGSNADGPHIDQKTARIIMSDERLFLVASVMNLTAEAQVGGQTDVIFNVTTRVLASMKTTLGNRRNASR